MTSIQYYHNLLLDDDNQIWTELDNQLYGSNLDQDIDNQLFSWES